MSSKSSANTSGGISFASLLAVVFITLKLLGKIDWSWFWVLSPLWIPLAIIILIVLVIAGMFVFSEMRKN